MNEQEIISQILKGNQQAFKELYILYKNQVYSTALSYLQQTEDAEEVTQDVFLTVFEKLDTFNRNSKISTWIYRITVNKSLNQIKKRKRNLTTNIELMKSHKVDFIHPGVLLENQEKSKYFFAAIDKLDENQKTAIILSYIEDLPRQEVAEIMNNTLKSIEGLLQRGKKNLHKHLLKLYPKDF